VNGPETIAHAGVAEAFATAWNPVAVAVNDFGTAAAKVVTSAVESPAGQRVDKALFAWLGVGIDDLARIVGKLSAFWVTYEVIRHILEALPKL